MKDVVHDDPEFERSASMLDFATGSFFVKVAREWSANTLRQMQRACSKKLVYFSYAERRCSEHAFNSFESS